MSPGAPFRSSQARRADGAASLLLVNARVLTLDPAWPRAEAVAVRGETIAAVGDGEQVATLAGPGARTIDCRGRCLLPGFVDAHCHLMAMAASLQGVDCGPEAVASLQDLRRAIQRRATGTPPGRWIRGFGYDDLALAEARHPTRWDLDPVSPFHPVRLDHRSGHAVVLNGEGLRLAGIHRDTPDPPEGVIERDGATGEPTGLLLEMGGFLRRKLGKLRDAAEMDDGIVRLNQRLLSLGITSVQDAGPNNGGARWEAFRGLIHSGRLECRVTMLAGASRLDEFLARDLRWGDGDERLRLGHAKVMLTLTTGALHPDLAALGRLVGRAHQAGFPVAIHAVEQEAVAAAARVIYESGPANVGEGEAVGGIHARDPARHRIEHCAECPPDTLELVRRSGALVVTQPGFIYWNGGRYRERADPSLLGHLYPVGALARSGVPVAFGSDAPVIDPNPWPAIYSAVTGVTRGGERLAPADLVPQGAAAGVPVESALRMFTATGARAEGSQDRKGTIRVGMLADLVLLDRDPTLVGTSELADIRPVLTVVGGRVVWNGGEVEAGH